MFLHIFLNRLKCLIRNKEMLFWTLLFPLILATLFNMAFANLNNIEKFEIINIAIVNNEQFKNDQNFKSAVSSVSNLNRDSKSTDLFNVSLVSEEEAKNLLENNKITAYIINADKVKAVVKSTGLYQTITKSFIDDYMQTNSVVSNTLNVNPKAFSEGLGEDLADRQNYIREVKASNSSPNSTLVYFYTLIAMACFYGGFAGLKEVMDVQANLSYQAARINLAPTHKLKVFASSLCAATLIQLMSIYIVLAYLAFILKIDFGAKLGYVLLTCLVGCLTGVSFGAFISALIKKGEGIKTAVLIGVTMTLSFLAGMMQVQVKYLVTTAAPIMAYINPLNLITDCFYTLYYYETNTRFFINIAILCAFTIVFSLITYLILRRQKYASI